MPRQRKVAASVAENPEDQNFVKPNSKVKPPAKKQKTEADWMVGNGANVINLVISVQKTDCNTGKVTVELTKYYKKVNFVYWLFRSQSQMINYF